MLDNEPDTNEPNSTDTPPPRRRRAASRAAGPPTATAEAVPSAGGDSATDADTTPAKKAAAKRTSKRAAAKSADGSPTAPSPRKRAAKKAVDGSPTAAAPRRRAAKKSAAVAEAEPPAEDRPGLESAAEPIRASDKVPDVEPGGQEEAVERAPQSEAEPQVEDVEFSGPTVTDTESAEAESAEAESSEAESTEIESTEIESTEVESTEAESTESEDEAGESGQRRRRRRRGGRRRRRGGDQDSSDDDADAEDATADADDESATADDKSDERDATEESEGGEGTSRRRRRRRRRRGEDSGGASDDPAEVVVRVREPRSRQAAAKEVTGIDGSTRMEAKRQRRREGREAGRRRPPILSEAEFLTRRESVSRRMVVRQRDDLAQIAVLEDDILVEHYVDRDSAASLIGNVYLGRVQNVLPSMEAAFIDIGRGRNAVLYAGEVDWDSFGASGQQRKVETVLKSGQTVLVQVTKDPVGAKGARLTNHISLPGRYIVYSPGGHLSGISRKLPDVERRRLKDILSGLVPSSASVIVRTAAEGASEDELVRDVNRLKAQWEDIERKVKSGSAPQLLYGEPDLTVRIVRDLFTEDFSELIIQGNSSMTDAHDAVDAYVSHVAPHLHDRLRRWNPDTDGDLFATFRIDEQIAKAMERKVFLPSGGSLIIERTEAMTVIDVNTGKFTGSGGNLEATVTSNNLEAAEEIVRQLRLRDIGGIIVIDFIDMVLPSNRELLLRRLVECLGRDRTRHQVAEVTSLGLVQMTRKKIGTGLLEAFSSECAHCHGRGYEVHPLPVESQKQPDGGAREQRGRARGGRRSSTASANSQSTPDTEPAPVS